jgi:hypothetical protein
VNQHTSTAWGRIVGIGLVLFLMGAAGLGFGQENQIRKAKIYDEIYPLLNEVDLYCSFLVHDGPKPEIMVIGAEREYEREIMSDGDVIYINHGRADGLEPGQLFQVLEFTDGMLGYGPLAFKRGRARVEALSDHQASAVIEKSCGWIRKGDYLIPFEPREPLMGKDLGYDVPPFEVEGAKGEIIYLQTDFEQVGSNMWALIDCGQEAGIQIGQQLIIYRVVREGAPLQIFGNCVVIDVQKETATIKVLSCRDAVRIGDLIMVRPAR